MNSLIGGFLLPDTFITRNVTINGGVTLLNLPSVISSSQTLTASYVSNRSFSSISSSFTTKSLSSSFSIIAQTSSFILNDFVDTGSFIVTSSGALTNKTASLALTSSKAIGTSSVTYSLTSSWASSSVSASYSIGALGGKVFPISNSLYIPYDDVTPITNKTILFKLNNSTFISCSAANQQCIEIMCTSSIGRIAQFQSVIIGTNLFITQSSYSNGCFIGHDTTVASNISEEIQIGNKILYAVRTVNNLISPSDNSCIVGHNFLPNARFKFIPSRNTIIGNNIGGGSSPTSSFSQGGDMVLVGNYAAYNSFTDSNSGCRDDIFIGNNCGYNNSASRQIFIGNNCGYNLRSSFGTNFDANILIGNQCAYNYSSSNSDSNVFIGNDIGNFSNTSPGTKNVVVGNESETNGYSKCVMLGNFTTASGDGQFVLGSQRCPIQISSAATIGSACPTLHSGSKFVIININGTPYKIACFNL